MSNIRNQNLNTAQRQAVEHFGTPLLVLAGAGSGKTGVITHRIAHLIQHHGIAAKHIFAVTFTNKAAREMKKRVGKLLSAEAAKELSVSTFHTLGMRMLREDGKALGYRKNFTIFDSSDSLTLLKQLRHESPDPAKQGEEDILRWKISRWKNDFITSEDAISTAANSEDLAHGQIYARYQTALQAYNAMDFDDLILQPVRLIEEHPEIKQKWQARIQHLLVDEYQDTNAAQYRLLQTLLNSGSGFVAVGDDDQSIYAWRGARPENLNQLSVDLQNLRVIKLEQNYRSSGRILKSANSLIEHNPHLFSKSLWSELGTGDRLKVLVCDTAEDEAARITAEICSQQFQTRNAYSDYAVLYRSNFQSRVLEKALREQGIPYQISGGSSFFERTEIKDLVAYLRLMVNSKDDAAFLRIANVPRREIGPTSLEKLSYYARATRQSLFEAAASDNIYGNLPNKSAQILNEFSNWLVLCADNAERGDAIANINELIERIKYFEWIQETSNSPKNAEQRNENVNELLEWVKRIAFDDNQQARPLSEIVAHMSLMDLLDRNTEESSNNAVQLMTLHSAKGLEFPIVYMLGMEENILPHQNSIEADSIEEERRLAYVGITRAQKELTFSYARKRNRYGEEIACQPSRFLTELPKEELIWDGEDVHTNDNERMAKGRSHLSSLKDLLGPA